MRRARVLLTGYSAILKVMAICARSMSSTTDEERRALVRMLAWSVGCDRCNHRVAALCRPFESRQSITRWHAATTLVPQAVPLAIPIGIAFGIAFGLSARPTHERREGDAARRAGCVGVELRDSRVGDARGESSLPGDRDSRAQGQGISRSVTASKGLQRNDALRAAQPGRALCGRRGATTRSPVRLPAFISGSRLRRPRSRL